MRYYCTLTMDHREQFYLWYILFQELSEIPWNKYLGKLQIIQNSMEYQSTKSMSNRNRIHKLECYSYAYQSLFIQEILQEKDNLQKRALGLKICRFQQYVLEASKSASAKSLRVHVPDASVLTNSLVRTMFIIIQRISNIGLLISTFISNLCMIRVQSVYNYYPTLCIYKVAQPSYVLYTIHYSTVKKILLMPNIYINIQNISSNQILLGFVSSIFCIIKSKLLQNSFKN